MQNKESQFAYFSTYVFFLVFMNILLVLKTYKMAWPIIIFFLFAIAGVSRWIQSGPKPVQWKDYLKSKGIKEFYLWIGITLIYYFIVGLIDKLA